MRLELKDIRLAWDDIKRPLELLKKRYSFDWRVEDIYSSCISGESFLWLCEDGFTIVQQSKNRFTLEDELFIWIIYSKIHNTMDNYYDELCEIAKSFGAEKMVFSSPRKGFIKMKEENGWKEQTTYYEMRIR